MTVHIPPPSNSSAVTNASPTLTAAASTRSIKWRWLVVTALLLTGILRFSNTYYLLRKEEHRLFQDQYGSVAVAAANSLSNLSQRSQTLTKSASAIYKYAFPQRKQWPFVAYAGFGELSNLLAEASGLDPHTLAFFPIVEPHQILNFESFAEQVLHGNPNIHPKNTSDESEWKIHAYHSGADYMGSASSRKMFHYSDVGSSDYGSQNHIATPLFQSHAALEQNKGMMLNVHFNSAAGKPMDSILSCVEGWRKGKDTATSSPPSPAPMGDIDQDGMQEDNDDFCVVDGSTENKQCVKHIWAHKHPCSGISDLFDTSYALGSIGQLQEQQQEQEQELSPCPSWREHRRL